MTLPLAHRDVPDSPLARWDARWKLAALVVAAFGIAALDRLAPSLVAQGVGLVLVALARLPRRWIRSRLGLFALAALPFLLVLPFTLDTGGPGWEVIGPVRVSERGLAIGFAVFARCLAIGCLSLVLVGTAPLHHTLAAAHKLKVPGLLVLIAGLAYRYTFLLVDEYKRVRVALRTRGFRMTATRHGYRTLGHVTGAILVRGAERADRVSEAMRCRGFDGTFHTTASFRTTAADVLALRGARRGYGCPCPLGSRGAVVTRHFALTTHCLSHRYADGRVALDEITFEIGPGECVALVGPNGAGKTTLFLRLCGVLAGKLGEANVEGLDPADPAHRKKLPETIGIVFQNPDDQLFSPTVLDDVAFGPLNQGVTPPEAKARAARSARGGRAAAGSRRSRAVPTLGRRQAPRGARGRTRDAARRSCFSMSRRHSSIRAAGAI